MKFDIPIIPLPKQRPRFNRKTGRIYTPSKTGNYESTLREEVIRIFGRNSKYPIFPKEVPVRLEVDFVFPQTATEKRLKSRPELDWNFKKTFDIDNLVKAFCDAMNTVLWQDDFQIVRMIANKLIGEPEEPGRICVNIRRASRPPVKVCTVAHADFDNKKEGLDLDEE